MDSLAVHLRLFCILMLGSLSLCAIDNCQMSLDEKVACSISSPNETTCDGMGCCWNPNDTMKCFTKKGGKCLSYTGNSCKAAINTTLLPYRDTPRFVDNKLGIVGTERFLNLVLYVIQSDDYVTDLQCRRILSTMLCHYTLPPCKPDNTIRPFCQEDCIAIFKRCQTSLNQVIGAVKHIAKTKNIDFIHTGFPNCSRYKPSTSYDMSSNDSCVKTGFFNFSAKASTAGNDGDINLAAIIVPVILIILLVVIVVAIFLWRRRKQNQNAMKNGFLVLGEGALTMRQKLRADSLKSLDSRMLRLYDPSKVKHYPLDNVEYLKDLGEGHFGKVFQGRAVGIIEGQPKKELLVAVKALKEGSSKELKEEFYQEVALMSIFQHPNIVSLIAVSTEEEPYGMIFEYMTEGDLNHYLRMAKPAEVSVEDGPDDAKVFLSQQDLVHIAEQVAAGMEHVASLKFVHRDLAARNCLVGKDLLVKIGDFGMSRDVYQSDYYKMSRETLLPIRWLAPEAFLYGKFTVMSDVYSYGVVLWETYTFGLQPYYGYTNKEVTEFIKKGIHLGKPDYCPDHIYSIMKACWEKDPRDRPDFTDIQKRLRDPFGNYDVPKSNPDSLSDQSDQGSHGDHEDHVDSGSQDFGNYDVPRSPLSSRDDIDKEDKDGPKDNKAFGTYDVPKDNDFGAYDIPKDNNFGAYDVPKDEFGAYDVPSSPPSGEKRHDSQEEDSDEGPKTYDPTEKKRSTIFLPVENSVEV